MRLDAKINQDPNKQNYKLSTNYTPTYSLIKVIIKYIIYLNKVIL